MRSLEARGLVRFFVEVRHKKKYTCSYLNRSIKQNREHRARKISANCPLYLQRKKTKGRAQGKGMRRKNWMDKGGRGMLAAS
jgi:hypothetical protein